MSLPLGHLSIRSCSLAAKSKPGKDAGSARSRRLRARLRTRHGAALQRARGREMVGRWPSYLLLLPSVRRERHAEPAQERKPVLVRLRGGRDRDIEAANLLDIVVVDLREDDLLPDAE